MLYKKSRDFPERAQHILLYHAQEIDLAAYINAYAEYFGKEER